jgi:cytochrome oxidase Cu insertion factor (SCO1/SenC/PrrC family)
MNGPASIAALLAMSAALSDAAASLARPTVDSPGAVRAPPVAHAATAPGISGHFQLQGPDGRQVTEASFSGKWLLVYFGYTCCPDVCPTVLLRVGQALENLGPIADRIQPIFITVDPARDTAARLSEYLHSFNPRIVGLRGDSLQTQTAARGYHAYYRARSLGNGEYTVDHSSFLYLVAPDRHFTKLLADSLSVSQLADEMGKVAK